MKRFLAVLLCVCLCVVHTVYAEEIEEPRNLYAQSAVLMDAESGRILFEKNGQEVLAMASTTKIMTCILALENVPRICIVCLIAKRNLLSVLVK